MGHLSMWVNPPPIPDSRQSAKRFQRSHDQTKHESRRFKPKGYVESRPSLDRYE